VLTLLLLATGGLAAGAFGAMLGLGGGVLIVPLLTLGFGQPITVAAGSSLVAVVATSASAAAHYVRTGQADVRLGLMLETSTVLGALAGGLLAGILPDRILALLFAVLLVYVAVTLGLRALHPAPGDEAMEVTDVGHVPVPRRLVAPALLGAGGAGVLSSLLGIGGGMAKVPLVHLLLRRSMRVSVATSNFVIGVTAAAGVYPYLMRGEVNPAIAGPVVLGVVAGSAVAARLASRIQPRIVSLVFVLVLAWTAFEMARRGLGW
jgi:hypothetical protein